MGNCNKDLLKRHAICLCPMIRDLKSSDGTYLGLGHNPGWNFEDGPSQHKSRPCNGDPPLKIKGNGRHAPPTGPADCKPGSNAAFGRLPTRQMSQVSLLGDAAISSASKETGHTKPCNPMSQEIHQIDS